MAPPILQVGFHILEREFLETRDKYKGDEQGLPPLPYGHDFLVLTSNIYSLSMVF
jgi:hypothetical protein